MRILLAVGVLLVVAVGATYAAREELKDLVLDAWEDVKAWSALWYTTAREKVNSVFKDMV